MFTDETMVKAYPNGEMVFYRASRRRDDLVSPSVQQGGGVRCFGVAQAIWLMDAWFKLMAILIVKSMVLVDHALVELIGLKPIDRMNVSILSFNKIIQNFA
jgi:predicted NBD/HSP70 family sugar kinase